MAAPKRCIPVRQSFSRGEAGCCAAAQLSQIVRILYRVGVLCGYAGVAALRVGGRGRAQLQRLQQPAGAMLRCFLARLFHFFTPFFAGWLYTVWLFGKNTEQESSV